MSIYDCFWESLEELGEPSWKLFLDQIEQDLWRRLINIVLVRGGFR